MSAIYLPDFVDRKLTTAQREELSCHLNARAKPFIALSQEFFENACGTGWSNPRPADKFGKEMNCVAHLNFCQLDLEGISTTRKGSLFVFLSESYKSSSAKDASCFRIVWQPDLQSAPNMVSSNTARRVLMPELLDNNDLDSELVEELSGWIARHNDGVLGQSYLFANRHPRLAEAMAISAFSANGVSYSQARASDSCYSHLVEAAVHWRLLFRRQMSNGNDLLLMIDEDDLKNHLLQKGWLVRF